jgi:hypothetical protein
MSKPPFVMSKYATREALLSDAANYYEAECKTLRAAIQTHGEEAARLVAQRDELLAALQLALQHINPQAIDKEKWKAGKQPWHINSIVSAAITNATTINERD